MSVTNEKKRSTLIRGSLLDLPANLDRKRFAYRWVSKARLDLASDGYEPRGYVPYTVEGKHVARGDLILCQKSKEESERDNEIRAEAAAYKTEVTLQAMKEKDAVLSHEVKKAGGKMKFEYGEE